MAKWIVLAAAYLLSPAIAAQDGPTARAFCDPADPRNLCPADCRCTEDVLAVHFERSGGPIIDVSDEPGQTIEAVVILETKSTGIQGWTYGVRHDGRALTIESVTFEGTDADRLFFQGLRVLHFQDLQECTLEGNQCSDRQPASGFIASTVLSLTQLVELPPGTNSIARATYRLEPAAADVAEGGILLEFTERLARLNSPPASIDIAINGKITQPLIMVDGRVFVSRAQKPFHRGDPDADGRLSVADAVALLLFLFLSGPAPGCLEAGDFDDSGRLDTADPVGILRWLFLEGSAPAPPGPPPAACGPDPKVPGQELGCDEYEGCLP